MPAFLLPILWRVGAALLVAFVVAAAWYKVNHWCNAACVNEKEEVVSLTAEVAERDASIATTQKRATEMAMLWSAQVDKTEAAAHQTESQRVQTFSQLRDAANSVNRGSGVRFSDAGRELFDRARSAAGGEATGPAAKPAETPPPAASSAEEFVVQLYEWAAICRARVDEWASFYAGLQQSSGSIQ
jgi:hypothetical protein